MRNMFLGLAGIAILGGCATAPMPNPVQLPGYELTEYGPLLALAHAHQYEPERVAEPKPLPNEPPADEPIASRLNLMATLDVAMSAARVQPSKEGFDKGMYRYKAVDHTLYRLDTAVDKF